MDEAQLRVFKINQARVLIIINNLLSLILINFAQGNGSFRHFVQSSSVKNRQAIILIFRYHIIAHS